MNDGDIAFYAILIAIAFAVWHFDTSHPWDNEITSYTQSGNCEPKKNGSTKCKWSNIPRVTYLINHQTQKVLSWPNEKSWPIYNLSDCKVISRKNWHCGPYDRRSGFRDGKFTSVYHTDYDSGTKKFRVISKTRWWLTHFLGTN